MLHPVLLSLICLITPFLYPSANASAAASTFAQPAVSSAAADQKSAAADVKASAAADTIHNAQEILPTIGLSNGSVGRGHMALKAEDFVWLQKVRGINLSGQNLKEFPIGILQHCPEVQWIDLSNNNIASLPLEPFEELWLQSNLNLHIILKGNPLPEYTKGYLRSLQKTKGATMCPSEHPGISFACCRMFVLDDVIRELPKPAGN